MIQTEVGPRTTVVVSRIWLVVGIVEHDERKEGSPTSPLTPSFLMILSTHLSVCFDTPLKNIP